MDNSTEVKLFMDGALADGLEVRRLTLREGFCRIPTAEVVLCSKGSPITMDDLAGYVEKPAALEISRKDAATTRRTTRWFSGMVSSVEGHGVVAESQSADVFEYHMTIQPRLVNLCYSRSEHNFRQMSALDALKEVLKGFDVEFGDGKDIPQTAKKQQDFFQLDVNDYEFMMQILGSCGLCYSFKMPAQKPGAVVPPMMYVTTGNLLPAASDFLCDGEKKLPSAFSCVAVQTDASYCRMDSWQMRKSIGVDRIEVGYTNRTGKDVRGGAGKGGTRRVIIGEGLSADAAPDDVERLADEHLRRLRASTAGWSGTTQCLEALPGNLLEVNHFYGRHSKEVVKALVCGSTLDCTVPVFSGEFDFGDGGKESVQIGIECVSGTLSAEAVNGVAQGNGVTAGGSVRLGASGGGSAPVSNGKSGGGGGGGGGGGAAAIPSFIRQVIVIGTGASDEKTNTAVKFVKGRGYVFKAKVGTGETASTIEVNFTLPTGGVGEGLFRMPRVGDRVLVLGQQTLSPDGKSISTDYYLLSYLPCNDMRFMSDDELARTVGIGLPEEMVSLRYRSPGTPDTNLDPSLAIRRNAVDNDCSEIAFYRTHISKHFDSSGKEVNETFDELEARERISRKDYQKGYGELKEDQKKNVDAKVAKEKANWMNAEETALKDRIAEEWYGKDKKYDKLGKDDKAKVDAEAKRRMEVLDRQNVLANFQSFGSMQLSANHNMEVNTRNLHICSAGRSGWKKKKKDDGSTQDGYTMDPDTGVLTINDFNKVLIKAKRNITLQVGRNTISINQNGISIRSIKRNSGGGPQDSYIYMDAITGTSIGGMSCSMNGYLSASMSEALGGSVVVGTGTASVGGAKVSLGTISGVDFVFKAANAVESGISQCVGIDNKGNKTANDNVYVSQSTSSFVFNDLYQVIRDFAVLHNTRNGVAAKNPVGNYGIDIILILLKFIVATIDYARLIMDAKYSDWMDQPAKGAGGEGADNEDNVDYMTNRDAMRYSILAAKLTVWATDIVVLMFGKDGFADGGKATNFLKISNFRLLHGEVGATTGETCWAEDKRGEYKSFFAGVAS